jgi:hypothetical protein
MPRYFFHLSFGQRVVPDDEGIELPNRTAARHEALAVVRDLANPAIGGNSRRWASWFLEVADERGDFFRTPIGHPALEIVRSDVHDSRAEEAERKPVRPATMAVVVQAIEAAGQTAEIVRELAARQQMTAQLLQCNKRLQRELSSLCVASEKVLIRARRLISLALAARGRC